MIMSIKSMLNLQIILYLYDIDAWKTQIKPFNISKKYHVEMTILTPLTLMSSLEPL